MANTIFVGDIGTKLKFDVNVSSDLIASSLLYYIKPDGTEGSFSSSSEADTYVIYVTLVDDIDIDGLWKFQPYVETSSGWKGYGGTVNIRVHRNISGT